VVTYYIIAFCVFCVLAFAAIAALAIMQLEKQRKEWQTERSQLLDRIQAGSFNEYKAQERAETPLKRKEKDPIMAKLEGEPWL
jgi:sortase (surface protein transpeptidase)